MDISLRTFLKKRAEDGQLDIENEQPEDVEEAPAETPAEGEAADLPTPETPETEQTKFITDAAEQMLCQQIGNEMFAFYEYTAAAAWLSGQGLAGFAAWATKQTCDEKIHMQKILDFLIELGCTPDLPQISGVPARFDSVKAAVEGIFSREKAVTKNWRIIAKQAMSDGDAGTLDLAQWFVREQMEEEDLVKAILSKLEAAGDGAGILVLDHMLLEEYGE